MKILTFMYAFIKAYLCHHMIYICFPSDLPKELFYQYNSSSHYIPNYEVLPLYFMKWEEDKMAETLSFLNNPQLEDRWKEFKKYLPLGMHRVEHIPQVK